MKVLIERGSEYFKKNQIYFNYLEYASVPLPCSAQTVKVNDMFFLVTDWLDNNARCFCQVGDQ